jgi:hypothetical protein
MLRMVNEPNGISSRPGGDVATSPEGNEAILILGTPKVEEIARVIWQRHMPGKFWNECMLDAQAVLSFFYKKHNDYRNARESATNRIPDDAE